MGKFIDSMCNDKEDPQLPTNQYFFHADGDKEQDALRIREYFQYEFYEVCKGSISIDSVASK